MLGNLLNVDEDLARRVARGIGMPLPAKSEALSPVLDMKPSDKLSIHKNMKKTLEGRSVGVLVANQTDKGQLDSLLTGIRQAKATPVVIGPTLKGIQLSDGSQIQADAPLAGAPSALFDAVALVLSKEGTEAIMKEVAAVQFVICLLYTSDAADE